MILTLTEGILIRVISYVETNVFVESGVLRISRTNYSYILVLVGSKINSKTNVFVTRSMHVSLIQSYKTKLILHLRGKPC